MTNGERKQIEHMMRVVVAAQGLLDTLLSQGDALLNPPNDQIDAPSAPKAAHPETAGDSPLDDPNDPPRFMKPASRPRATIPHSEG